MARRHIELGPNFRKVLFFYAEQVDPLSAGKLDHRHVVFLRHRRDPLEIGRGSYPAVDARHDGISAVLLDVGVVPLIGEAGLLLVHIFRRPEHA
ncbi:hypothetical protein D1872_256990 [compost metagenome]